MKQSKQLGNVYKGTHHSQLAVWKTVTWFPQLKNNRIEGLQTGTIKCRFTCETIWWVVARHIVSLCHTLRFILREALLGAWTIAILLLLGIRDLVFVLCLSEEVFTWRVLVWNSKEGLHGEPCQFLEVEGCSSNTNNIRNYTTIFHCFHTESH